MAKLLYSVSMSADGYIAGPGGDMSWLTEHLGPNPEVDELVKDIGALLVGNRTFGGDDPHKGDPGEGKAFGGGWSGPQFVLTHNPPAEAVPGITFVSDLEAAIAAAKGAAGDRYVNVLGADVARQCLLAGELDEILTIVVPVLLGAGTPVFEVSGGHHVRLQRKSQTDATGAANLWYRVVR